MGGAYMLVLCMVQLTPGLVENPVVIDDFACHETAGPCHSSGLYFFLLDPERSLCPASIYSVTIMRALKVYNPIKTDSLLITVPQTTAPTVPR